MVMGLLLGIPVAMICALRPRSCIDRHVIRNAFLRFVAIAGLMMITVIGGTVVIEAVFTYPGLGRLLLQRRKVVLRGRKRRTRAFERPIRLASP